MLNLVKNDPWLEPFSPTIEHRHQLAMAKEKELCGPKGSLSDFADGYLYFGLHRNEKGEWVIREWAPISSNWVNAGGRCGVRKGSAGQNESGGCFGPVGLLGYGSAKVFESFQNGKSCVSAFPETAPGKFCHSLSFRLPSVVIRCTA